MKKAPDPKIEGFRFYKWCTKRKGYYHVPQTLEDLYAKAYE